MNIFLHIGMDKMYRGASLLNKNKFGFTFSPFTPFLQILPGDFGRVFP
jgi:hypothetical protein